MSLDASIWAWKVRQKQKPKGSIKPLKKLVLLSLADRASEDHCAYPSVARLVEDTEMDRKTVLKIIDELIEDGLIVDTGERKGRTKQVKVYQLVGVNGRETVPTTVLLNTENDDLNSPNSGTVPTTEQFQQFHERVPTIPLNSPNVGTRNLSKNLSLESKNIKAWLCFKKLREEMHLADESIDFETIMKSNWANREKRAFEIYNAEKNLCDDLMIYHFADWLINAYRNKYSNTHHSNAAKPNGSSAQARHLSEKQIQMFAQKLSHHSDFISRFSEPGESYDKLATRIAVKLEDPAQAKKWESYLKQVGFEGVILGDMA
ncbi:helix-turn-helix domain-containing protein [Acinetobacter sp. ANC 3832]|uniref:helix-turn-helix domain-containing protein n=1 Tax=Acinetobacter sp. ANC 3832 TaxID=1977874 RepID=UPI000A337830|nr:helix-turn-helix domain-containing protein [Acinetobacter sp. ANC 3832]OTG93681.1 helix-turn-helix domain-containing protein [Acinetobacter sp. ANC 3832]